MTMLSVSNFVKKIKIQYSLFVERYSIPRHLHWRSKDRNSNDLVSIYNLSAGYRREIMLRLCLRQLTRGVASWKPQMVRIQRCYSNSVQNNLPVLAINVMENVVVGPYVSAIPGLDFHKTFQVTSTDRREDRFEG